MASLAVVPSDSSAMLTRMLTRLSGTSVLLRELDQYYTGTQPLSVSCTGSGKSGPRASSVAGGELAPPGGQQP
jgi:hypothetical protein